MLTLLLRIHISYELERKMGCTPTSIDVGTKPTMKRGSRVDGRLFGNACWTKFSSVKSYIGFP